MGRMPIVGDRLHYWPSADDALARAGVDAPLAAVVCHVGRWALVNLQVLDMNGTAHVRLQVPFHWRSSGTLPVSYCAYTDRQRALIQRLVRREGRR